jgi:hypothetical protein
MENLTNISDEALLESAQQIAEELERRGLRLSRSLGEHAVDGTEYETAREEADPFLKPGSPAAKQYASARGRTGMRRWMEPLSKVDVLGRPTVFSDGFGSQNHGR